jgi:hypothetical protein
MSEKMPKTHPSVSRIAKWNDVEKGSTHDPSREHTKLGNQTASKCDVPTPAHSKGMK